MDASCLPIINFFLLYIYQYSIIYIDETFFFACKDMYLHTYCTYFFIAGTVKAGSGREFFFFWAANDNFLFFIME